MARLIELIKLVIENKEQLQELFELISEIIGMFRGGTAVAMTEESANNMGLRFVELKTLAESAGFTWWEIVQLIIANKELIQQFVEAVLEFYGKK